MPCYTKMSFQSLPVLENLNKRSGAQFVARQAGKLQRFFFSERAAVDGPQKVIEQSLARGRIIKYITDQSSFRGLLNEVAQSFRSGVQALEKERIDRGITRRQLRRVQIPALIKTTNQRMLNVIVVQLPRAMNHTQIFLNQFVT